MSQPARPTVVEIVEDSPHDGLQNEDVVVSTADTGGCPTGEVA